MTQPWHWATLHFTSLSHLLLPSPFPTPILSPLPIALVWDVFFSPLDFQIHTSSCSSLHLYGPLLHTKVILCIYQHGNSTISFNSINTSLLNSYNMLGSESRDKRSLFSDLRELKKIREETVFYLALTLKFSSFSSLLLPHKSQSHE